MFHQQNPLKGQLNNSLSTDKEFFYCHSCGKQYNTQIGYRRHLVAFHSTSAGKPCPEDFPDLLENVNHLGDMPPTPEGSINTPVRERKYSCERCERRFYTRKDVRRHAVVHTGRRDFLCPRCTQRFGRRDHLTRHLKKSHAQESSLMSQCASDPPLTPAKEESGLLPPDGGGVSKDSLEVFPRDICSSYPLVSPVPGMGHTHMQGSLSAGMGVGPSQVQHQLQPPSAPQQQSLNNISRYQHGFTTYPRSDMDSFLLDLQSAPPPQMNAVNSSTSTSPQRETVVGVTAGGDTHLMPCSPTISTAELSCTSNMELGPLLGFLPFSLPPYSPHMGMGGLVMSYPPAATTSSSSSSSSTVLSGQAPGTFSFFQPPQAHVPQGPAVHSHSQLPQPSSCLSHYYQAFQQ
uniref:C2H2-type domain-containing protein n=1 Tax=Oryzias latipes TaxID=8090 RepID=A0A3P9I9J7_ORYLA